MYFIVLLKRTLRVLPRRFFLIPRKSDGFGHHHLQPSCEDESARQRANFFGARCILTIALQP